MHHNKDMEHNETVIGVEGDEVCHDLGVNLQIEMMVEEGRLSKTKTALTLKSPYLTRVVDPRDNANTSERNIWKWVVRNKDEDREEVVFNGYNILVERGHLLTFESGHHISPRVVDAWSCILNHKEMFRSVASPARFFAKTINCMFMSEGEVEKDVDAYKVVSDALDYGWSLTNPCNADMIIFPVMQHRWCYCICVNLKVNRVDILDSSSAGVAKIDKYDEMPNVVRNMVVKYFENKGMDGRVEKVKAQLPKRLQLPWRDSTAIFDCGVITMRHMETYTGQTLKRWDCGLKKGDGKAVNALRTKYCAAIVESDVNGVREKIRQLVKHNTG
ncbi:unnamed protein product [Cuscuta campestris]|uniref:Ubiquitin-like protease family profile domain-containing protein n=1 Tax=Cuscuta campestris TaxID=132261 RepID=A0A484KZF8_9ASTE|nr:unnamed protein product [Cuscuta campestris]